MTRMFTVMMRVKTKTSLSKSSSNKKRFLDRCHLNRAPLPRRKSRREAPISQQVLILIGITITMIKNLRVTQRATTSVERNIRITVNKSLKIPRGSARFLNLPVNSVSSLIKSIKSEYPINKYDHPEEISNNQLSSMILKVHSPLVMIKSIRHKRSKLEAVYMQVAT